MARLRIGYIPEHFSTPIAFAHKHFGLDADLIPFPTGTGALAGALNNPDPKKGIQVAVGLTEGFIADLGKSKSAGEKAAYGLVGTYVESPLCWAISTGAKREDVNDVSELKGKKVGVSRIGSGSYVMSFVLGDQRGWLESPGKEPFPVVPIGDFAALRKSVGEDRSSDFFMWEHFTTKHFWDNGELKRIGEIYTPWPSWMIVARDAQSQEVKTLLEKINQGVQYYRENKDEAVEYITTAMHYSKEDAHEWMKTVKFAEDVTGVSPKMVDSTAATLRKAGVLKDDAGGSEHMVTLKRKDSDQVANPADV
ncbi:hypothetical protein M409DRAFT_16745 [Zasmidium cellare ATCC 36951]|uniref:Ca3427-like PBP 2 domain-containing protein n=1 Tax=Zasmidium cellare ATCC 36951 TaxID=1080233 RepID=A0A6A6D038_ZASCE|nr:uncharacterized protein M409DRAFT_16745 [Zasmidium cellare ATCC 36951]KAF2172784.1 hypothetical protein M409DRAFT_16745 [Zasmidium cellare ATCC 36951]